MEWLNLATRGAPVGAAVNRNILGACKGGAGRCLRTSSSYKRVANKSFHSKRVISTMNVHKDALSTAMSSTSTDIRAGAIFAALLIQSGTTRGEHELVGMMTSSKKGKFTKRN
jgi:hypothetical protein